MLDRLTLDQLRVLVAVAETGSFSAAARRLGRVQSAISQTVQSLESALGIAVFERAGKTPKLSDAGRVILDDARHLLRGADTLRARAESIAADVEPGKEVAAQSGCLACHKLGDNGNNGPGPELTHIGARLPRSAIARSLQIGPSIMPSYQGLPPQKFNALTQFLASLN